MDPTQHDSERRFRWMMVASSVCVLLAAGFLGACFYFAAYADARGARNQWPLLLAAGVLATLAYVFRGWAGARLRDTWGPPTSEASARWRRRAIGSTLISIPCFVGVLYFLWAYGGMTPGEVARMAASMLLSALAIGVLIAALSGWWQRPGR